jgi:cytochrome c-type protein NapC
MAFELALLIVVIGLGAIFALFFILRVNITESRGGKILAFVCLLIFPAIAMTLGTQRHMENMRTTQFCTTCHVMGAYGQSLRVEDAAAIPAQHFQNRRISRDEACYTCHTDYALFGGVKSKIRGLRHLYAQYTKHPEAPVHLYSPYPNANCLHCHEGARTFEEGATHTADPDLMPAIKSGQKSCMSSGCHDVAHNIAGLKDAKFWKETP